MCGSDGACCQITLTTFCAAHRRVSLYFAMGHPFPRSSKLPLPMGDLGRHLKDDCFGPPESTTQTASRSVQPLLQGSLLRQTDRRTDLATRSVTIGRIYVRNTAMPPNNNKWSMQFDIRPHRRRIRQVAQMYPPMKAYWRHLANTIEFVLPSAQSSPQPKRQFDRFSRFLHSSRQKVPILYNGTPLSPQNCPFQWLNLDSNTWFPRPSCVVIPNGISIG